MVPAGIHQVVDSHPVADIRRTVDIRRVVGRILVVDTHRAVGHIRAVDCYRDQFEVVLGERTHLADQVDLGLDPD